MPVLLRTRSDLPRPDAYDVWAVIGSAELPLEPARRVTRLPFALEEAFIGIADAWLTLGRHLAHDPSAELAHAPACAANISDLGQMMAWAALVARWSAAEQRTLVVCDDPWMFRHLAMCPGVGAGKAPNLAVRALRLWLRGYAARFIAALRFLGARLSFRPAFAPGDNYILVYGHPRSTAGGVDGYFGELMRLLPDLKRILHVDCGPQLARRLAADGRTLSLHGFGSVFATALLPFAKWRPARAHCRGEAGWLVRRAAAHEGGTAQGAAIRWQAHCQARFLAASAPRAVAWPWENHSWERHFVRIARARNVMTIGYQHSVVGALMLNYSPHSGIDLAATLPHRIICNGEATRRRLAHFGIPDDRLAVGGALRYTGGVRACHYDAKGPIFVAFPFDGQIARQMTEACRAATRDGWHFLLKPHPMTPYEFTPSPGVAKTAQSLGEIGGVRAVLYAATAVGQEAIMAGIPTLRFLPHDRVAIDVLPEGIDAQPVTHETLPQALLQPVKPPAVSADWLFAPVDRPMWQKVLSGKENHDR